MSQEDVDLVRGAFDAWQRGDADEALEASSDDLITYRADPDGATYRGKKGFFEALADWVEGFSEWSVEPIEYVDTGGSVIVRVRQRARGEISGIAVEEEFWFVHDVRGQRISKISFYSRRDDAFAAAKSRQ